MVNEHSCGFDFLKKKFQNFFWVRVRARYKPSLVFRLSMVWSKFKLMFSAGIQLFGLKPLHMVNLTSKYEFLGQIYDVKWFSGQKV